MVKSSKPSSSSGASKPMSAVADDPMKHVTTIKGLKESQHTIALRALRSLTKSIAASVMLDDVPHELLFGEKVDLHRWTMILKDSALEELAEQASSDKKYYLDSAADSLNGMFQTFWHPYDCPHGLLHLDVSNAKDIQDYGITRIAHSSVELRALIMPNCSKVTDIGLREVAMHCPKLQVLNIASCANINGPGLVAVSDCCAFLSKLNISKNSQLQNWSLQHVFRKLKHIEELVCSYMKDISDDELRVLAEHNPDMVHLEAVECLQLTDDSVLSLARHCPDLDYVDLSRSDMASRITDVSLMALGQHSHTLRTLKLNHCDHVTDVGIGWLTDGCKMLETLELYGCAQITDAGLRVLGSTCRALTSLDVSLAKTISDIGLASLSRGCKLLQNIKVSGIFFLADPRIERVSSNSAQKQEMWEEVIGIAALAHHCPNLHSLDISGCFRLDKSLAQDVSTLSSLRVLNLKGLNQVTSKSLVKMFRGLRSLEEVVATDTGKGITDDALQALQQHCPQLRSLVLIRCTSFHMYGVSAISKMAALEKLDLSHCRQLTDSNCVTLTTAGTLQKLSHLDVTAVEKLTDSFLSWLAMKDHVLLYLCVKKTAITQRGIHTIRDRFPHSEMQINPNFAGFVPKSRVHDRILIHKYHMVIQGVTKVQARVRKTMAGQRVAFIRRHLVTLRAQAVLQRIARGYLARKITKEKRRIRDLHFTSAVRITSIFRMVVPKRKLKNLKYEKYLKMLNSRARIAQCAYRKYVAKCELLRRKAIKEAHRLYRLRCTIKIQSIGRMYLAALRCRRLRAFNLSVERMQNRKAVVIQRYYRGYQSRKITLKYKAIIVAYMALREKCAKQIQNQQRRHRMRVAIEARRQYRIFRLRCCVAIQALMRGALTRLHVNEIRMEHRTRQRQVSAMKIQCRFRVYRAKTRFMTRLQLRLKRRAQEHAAANVIIAAARFKLAWKKLLQKRREYLQRMQQESERIIQAAVTMQALARRFLARKYFMVKLKEQKSKWKELFDEKLKKRFFYNKLTGEIRWRIPQDLLDLLPHPVCDNCAQLESILECKECNELYCGDCFTAVHRGGRRKEHQYRALYDYYGKRLDYGDAQQVDGVALVYPCQWPSEVIQDEIQGWMLRIAPHRQPVKIHKKSGWEEYHFSPEEVEKPSSIFRKNMEQERVHNSMSKHGPRVFYFNRKTFQSSYDLPSEVAAELYEEQMKAQEMILPQAAVNNMTGLPDYLFRSSSNNRGNTAAASSRAQTSAAYYDQTYNYGNGIAGGQQQYADTSTGFYHTNGANNNYGQTGEAVDYSQWGYYDAEGNWVWYNNAANNMHNFDATYAQTANGMASASSTMHAPQMYASQSASNLHSYSQQSQYYEQTAYDDQQHQYQHYDTAQQQTAQSRAASAGDEAMMTFPAKSNYGRNPRAKNRAVDIMKTNTDAQPAVADSSNGYRASDGQWYHYGTGGLPPEYPEVSDVSEENSAMDWSASRGEVPPQPDAFAQTYDTQDNRDQEQDYDDDDEEEDDEDEEVEEYE